MGMRTLKDQICKSFPCLLFFQLQKQEFCPTDRLKTAPGGEGTSQMASMLMCFSTEFDGPVPPITV